MGVARIVTTARVNRVRRAFKWAASEELVRFAVYQALAAVRGFEKDRGVARESDPVRPVYPANVEATRTYVPPAPAATVRLQRMTGMPPGKACHLREADLGRSEPMWVYAPAVHETSDRGCSRTIRLGPRPRALGCRRNAVTEQGLLTPWKVGGYRIRR